MKIKPGARQESLTELPYTEAAIAGICIHSNIVQTMYSDLMPVLDSTAQQSFWSRARDDERAQRAPTVAEEVSEWQVRMVMEVCDLGVYPPACSSARLVPCGLLLRQLTARALCE